jgi:predicted enzyme related to lactoylglutathione lyase
MDTTGGERLGRFWADALGLEFHPNGDVGYLTGPTEGHGIAMCHVPEAKTVKHRVHIDVKTPSVSALERLGASVVRPAEESGLRWTVMADPEGGELCAFVRDPADLDDYRFYVLVVDAANGQEIAGWWADVFGLEARSENDGEAWAVDDVPGMPFTGMLFIDVPEPKTVKNRIHWDVYADLGDMQAAGATLLRPRGEDIGWDVMADPEGNEFCVFVA